MAQGLIHPIKVQAPFEIVGWDILGPFPESQEGNKLILIITEYFTRWAETTAIPDAKATTIATKTAGENHLPPWLPIPNLLRSGTPV